MFLFVVLFYSPVRELMASHYNEFFMLRFPILYGSMAVFTAIAMISYHRAILLENDYSARLNAEVEKQTAIAVERADKLEHMTDEIVHMLAVAIDAKDRYTNGHSFRVAAYAAALGRQLNMPQEEIDTLHQEAMLHDIGKIGVPDAVLNKPGRLTPEEFEIIKSHAAIGGKILARSSDMQGAVDVACFHHERYDGRGYPSGRRGAEIPYHARIVSIADAYDAMRSNRIYRKGLPPEKIREELIRGRASQFDPVLLDEFLKLADSGELDQITESANKDLMQSVELGLLDNVGDRLPITEEKPEEKSEAKA
jgi:HD-GYP domain-containing protein (c-di-GMP phosphodiesterase class II)